MSKLVLRYLLVFNQKSPETTILLISPANLFILFRVNGKSQFTIEKNALKK